VEILIIQFPKKILSIILIFPKKKKTLRKMNFGDGKFNYLVGEMKIALCILWHQSFIHGLRHFLLCLLGIFGIWV
jgi:hypothetical protein